MSDTKQPEAENLKELMAELDRREEQAKASGMPFNKNALLRRLIQAKSSKFYDSAEYILKNGCQSDKFAYLDPQSVHTHGPETQPASRLTTQKVMKVDEGEGNEDSYEYSD